MTSLDTSGFHPRPMGDKFPGNSRKFAKHGTLYCENSIDPDGWNRFGLTKGGKKGRSPRRRNGSVAPRRGSWLPGQVQHAHGRRGEDPLFI